MSESTKTYDLFISHSATDASIALQIASACRANGIHAVTYTELLPEANASDALWEALAESRALLAVLSPSGPTPSMAIELGAAQAWNKPIFAILTDPATTGLPPGLAGIRFYTAGRIDDVIRAIKASGQELSDDDRVALARLYAEIAVSVDDLAFDPTHLAELVTRFHAATQKTLPGERLLSELLRMRKQGKLVKSRSAERVKPRKGTA